MDSPQRDSVYLSVTEFQRNIKDHVGRLSARFKKLRVLTVNGRGQLILERLERAETIAAICRGFRKIQRKANSRYGPFPDTAQVSE